MAQHPVALRGAVARAFGVLNGIQEEQRIRAVQARLFEPHNLLVVLIDHEER